MLQFRGALESFWASAHVHENNIERDYEVYTYDNAGRKTKLQFVLEPPGMSGRTMHGIEGTEQS